METAIKSDTVGSIFVPSKQYNLVKNIKYLQCCFIDMNLFFIKLNSWESGSCDL